MIGPLVAVEICRQSLLRLARQRATWILFAVALANAGLFLFIGNQVAEEVRGTELFGIPGCWLVLQFLTPFAAMYLAIAAVHGDLEDGTSQYLFVRPVARPALLAGKWLAATLLAALLGTFALGGMYLALALPGHEWEFGIAPRADHLGVYLLAVLFAAPAYAAVGTFAATSFRRPLIPSAMFLFGWDLIVSNLPPESGMRTATIADPVRRWLLLELRPTGDLREALATSLQRLDPAVLGEPVPALLRFTLGTLLIAMVVYTRREYHTRTAE